MAFNFPETPSENTEYTPAGGPTYVYKSPVWMVKAIITAPAPFAFFISGKPAVGAKYSIVTPFTATIPASLAGSRFFTSTVSTGAPVFTVNRVVGGTTTAFGTFTITAGSATVATLAGSGGSLAVGDALQIVAPGTQDATLADISFTVLGTRT